MLHLYRCHQFSTLLLLDRILASPTRISSTATYLRINIPLYVLLVLNRPAHASAIAYLP
jgi:hypothetical protein